MLPKRKEVRPVQQARARQVVSGSYGGGQVEEAGSERVKAVEGWEARAAAIGVQRFETNLSRAWFHPKLHHSFVIVYKFDYFTAIESLRAWQRFAQEMNRYNALRGKDARTAE